VNILFEGKLFLEVNMGKVKPKIILDRKKSEQKKAIRIPFAKPVEVMEDKTKYKRREKHIRRLDE